MQRLDIVIPVYNEEQTVREVIARVLAVEGGGHVIEDLSSLNGTFVNRRRADRAADRARTHKAKAKAKAVKSLKTVKRAAKSGKRR